MRRIFYTFQTKIDLNLTQIQRWIWEEQLIEPKIQRLEILPWIALQHPLLPTSVAPLQQTRWCWNLGRTFYTFQTKIDLNLTQIQRWIWEAQLIEPKIQRLEILPWTTLQHPLLPTSVAPLQQTRWCWNLGRTFYTFQTKTNLNLTQIQRWIWEAQLIEPKIQRLFYKYLLHTTSFHAWFLHTPFPWTPLHT